MTNILRLFIGFTVFAGVRKQKDADYLKETAIYPDKLIPLILDVTKQNQVIAKLWPIKNLAMRLKRLTKS